ncbi:MAG: hypothetical protein M1830_005047 [Pleopsidium flavum]|nr:MAG: hypothetical protein M1830_005047 [Pleopsidium flavum]
MAAFAVLCRLNTCFSSLLDTEFALQVPLSQAVDDVNHCLDGLLRRFREARETVNNGSLHLGQAVIVPHGQYLHSAFTLLEMCKLISTFSEAADIKAKSRSSLPKEQATRLRELVENFYRFIRKDAMYIKNCLYKDTVIGELLHVILEKEGGEKDSVATAIASLVEKPWIEKSCGDLVESWQDAVDGVLKVKLGLY